MFNGGGGYGVATRPTQNSNNQIQAPNPNSNAIDSLDCPITAPAAATSYKCTVLEAERPTNSSTQSSSSSSPEATRAKRKHPSSLDAPTQARVTATTTAHSSGANGTDSSCRHPSNDPSNKSAQHAGSPPLSRASPVVLVGCREGATHVSSYCPCLSESRSSTPREAPASAEGAAVRVPWATASPPSPTHTSSATAAPAADPLRWSRIQSASAPAIALPLPIASAIVHVPVPPSESASNSEAALLEACEQHLAALGIDMSETPGSRNYLYQPSTHSDSGERKMNSATPASGIARWTRSGTDKCTGCGSANASLSLNAAPNMRGDSCISNENRVSISANECAHIASTRHAPQTRAETLDTALGENIAAAHFSGGSNTHSHCDSHSRSRSHWGTQRSGDGEYICSKPAAFSADNTSKSTSRISSNSEFISSYPAAPTSTTATTTSPALDLSEVQPSLDTDRKCSCCSDNEHTMSSMPADAVCKKLLVLHVATVGHNDELEFGVDEAPIVLLAYVLLDVETNTKVRLSSATLRHILYSYFTGVHSTSYSTTFTNMSDQPSSTRVLSFLRPCD